MKCEEKYQYLTRAEAKRSSRRLNRKYRDDSKVFKCRKCGCWHRGHPNPVADGFHQREMENSNSHRFFHHVRVCLSSVRMPDGRAKHGFGHTLFRALCDIVPQEEARRLLDLIEQPLKYESHNFGALMAKYPLRALLRIRGECIGEVFLGKDAVAQGRFSV